MLSSTAVQEFKEIYLQELGIELSNEEAVAKATKFLRLFRMVYQPIPKEWLKKQGENK
jgi:hypothetical protein